MKKFGSVFKINLSERNLQNMYALLDEEAKHFSMGVAKAVRGMHTITLRFRTEDAMYFARLIEKAEHE
ncbi:hypothetical protein [uncultured Prevotella sp.]|jgi:hypothetical protein|uniref:hypothetical protein n=1 Tax=uncultured Prevotella sp. TaxID=159272 RepID=UPI002065D1C1|nr:hypothetical protein [uncultured Prevotella sp.]DAQ70376.1 MAG TPA: hypothetical protein [Caudoviricetes sp.]